MCIESMIIRFFEFDINTLFGASFKKFFEVNMKSVPMFKDYVSNECLFTRFDLSTPNKEAPVRLTSKIIPFLSSVKYPIGAKL